MNPFENKDIFGVMINYLDLQSLVHLKRVNRFSEENVPSLKKLVSTKSEGFYKEINPGVATELCKMFLRQKNLEKFVYVCGSAKRHSLSCYDIFKSIDSVGVFDRVFEEVRKHYWVLDSEMDTKVGEFNDKDNSGIVEVMMAEEMVGISHFIDLLVLEKIMKSPRPNNSRILRRNYNEMVMRLINMVYY